MHRYDITAALKKAGSSQSAIAREFDVSPTFITSVVAGRAMSRRIAERIATIIGKPVESVFPRYGAPSRRKTGRRAHG